MSGRASAPFAGSFIRPTRRFDEPLTFVEALYHKYRPQEVDDRKVTISGKVVEEIGFGKIRQQLANVQTLKTLDLSHSRIAGGQKDRQFTVSEIRNLSLRVETLDLGSNLLDSWKDVVSIIKGLRHLKCLRLQ